MATSNSYKATLNLPQTSFSIRANHSIDDPLMLERWEKEDLYECVFYHNEGNEKFILSDGPPYANGPIHLGHAYNKILKDIVAKAQRMQGKHVPVTPGWDCHGLPIEIKVSSEQKQWLPAELKKACRAYAQYWIEHQIVDFKSLGVVMHWQQPYRTMDFEYEATVLRGFASLVEKGYIERKNKTVPWCYSCQTVLATAEIEYQERKDPSLYVLFPLTVESKQRLGLSFAHSKVSMVVWTTTPWTLPLNKAVLLKSHTTYVVLRLRDEYIIVAKDLAAQLLAMLDEGEQVQTQFGTDALQSRELFVHNPLSAHMVVPVIIDPAVMAQEGTAIVHNAPGAGPDDYDIGIAHGLEIFSPIDPKGQFTISAPFPELVGMRIDDAQGWVIKKLVEQGNLLHKTSIRHQYPHCWRCHNGLMFRATKQWFCNLLHNDLKQKSIAAVDTITMVPETAANRLKATIEARREWCLSRQRVWGTPIVALLCAHCDAVYANSSLIEAVADGVETEGIEYWDRIPIEKLVPSELACVHCKSTTWIKEKDILDVWFDAGLSHDAVLRKNSELGFPADLYLEGKDQHRGYFQSALLTSMALFDTSCMRAIVTHGFTVDQTGRKMSKSIGNVVSPQDMTHKIGTDCLRLWAATIDVSAEAVVSDILIQNVQEVFRKIRNTARFLLSNIYDFQYEYNHIPLHELSAIDHYALQELVTLQERIIAAYNAYDFTAVVHMLADYCSVNLSAFYLDIIKDRLYVEKTDGVLRRSAQTVCYYILDTLTKLMAPILSFAAESISDHYQRNKKRSIHLQSFVDLSKVKDYYHTQGIVASTDYAACWELIKNIRNVFLKSLEALRNAQSIKHSLEAEIVIYVDPASALHSTLDRFAQTLKNQSMAEFLAELVIVSQVTFVDQVDDKAPTVMPGLHVTVQRASGTKCPRCWQWKVSHHHDGLCDRCSAIVAALLTE